MFFNKKPDFDDFLKSLPEADKKPLLDRFLIIELANAWLKESGLPYEAKDVFFLVKVICGR